MCGLVVFYRGLNKQLSQVVDTLFVSPIITSNNKYTLLLLSINLDHHMRCKGLCNNLAYNQCDSGKLMNSRKPSD